MKKLNKLVLNNAKIMSAPQMKNITGGYDWGEGMRTCYINYCSVDGEEPKTMYFGCSITVSADDCIMVVSSDPDFCGGGCFAP